MFSFARSAVFLTLVMVVILAGCGDDSTGPKNQSPSAPVISPTDFAILPSGSVLFKAEATDPDGDEVTYAWTFGGGSPVSANGAQVTWTAPTCDCDVDIMVGASDGKGGMTSHSITVTVTANAIYPYAEPFEGTLEPDLTMLSEGAGEMAAPLGTCHFWASAAVVWTNAAVVVFTGIPALAFLDALTHPPVWYPPAKWLWAYTVPGAPNPTTVELYAELTGATSIEWKMLVSGTAQQFDGFQWVTGTSRTDGTAGHWVLYDTRVTSDQVDALRVEWSRLAMDDRDLDYFNVLESSTGFGDSLSYSVHGTEAEVSLYKAVDGTSTRILWDTEEGSGTFIGPGGVPCCWGPAPTFPDVACE